MEKNLKLIAIVPPEPVYSEVRAQQEHIASHWGPKRALRTPPHITLIPPMQLQSDEVGWLLGMAAAIAGAQESFTIELKDYGSFKPRVIYINPVSNPNLSDLHQLWHESIMTRMPQTLEKYPDRPYHPHMTLAHKDVTHTQFDAMWKHFQNKSFDASFIVNRFSFLTHTEAGWVVEREFLFYH